MIQVCLDQSWPKDKPIAQIVFPKILPSNGGPLLTLWVMLPKEEIQNRRYSKFQKEFIFTESPHPMLLWVTAMMTQEQEPRWLPCYLDLKDTNAQEIVKCLAAKEYYHILFFPIEEPQSCIEVMTATLNHYQCRMLTQWTRSSQFLEPFGRPSVSKRLLKQEFEAVKSSNSILQPVSQIA